MSWNFPQKPKGGFTRPLKYDHKVGAFLRSDRVQRAYGDWENVDVDITDGFSAIFDFANVECGYVKFSGKVPHFVMAPFPGDLPEAPSSDYRAALRLHVHDDKLLGGLREMSVYNELIRDSLFITYTDFVAAPEAERGLLPVVRLAGIEPAEQWAPNGTTEVFVPRLAIARWVARPADLPDMTPTAHREANGEQPRNGAYSGGGGRAVGRAVKAYADLDDKIPFRGTDLLKHPGETARKLSLREAVL